MATHTSSVSTGHYGLMATVWLVLVAMFTAMLATQHRPQPEAAVTAPALIAMLTRQSEGETPKTSERVPVVFFEGGSAALTEAGGLWLRELAGALGTIGTGDRLRLDILPPNGTPEATAARVASVVSLLGAVGADTGRVEIRSQAAGDGARLGLVRGGRGDAQ